MRLTPALLTSAAALALASTAASAADLPTKKAAPVEYVRVCSVHGAGFWYIPGTDTCIKLAGRVRAEFGYFQPLSGADPGYFQNNYLYDSWSTPGDLFGGYGYNYARIYGRDKDATGYEVNGRLDVDVRTSTQWGTLRAFFRYDLYVDTGGYTGGYGYSSIYTPGTSGTNGLDKAYIQWAGITAGRATSFFDFYANDYLFGSLAGSDHTTQLFAYTASFGSGFSATLSVEDPTVYNGGYVGATWGFGAQGNTDSGFSVLPYPYLFGVTQGGTRVPDIVANLRVDQGWGSAQLSGVLHQVRAGAYNAYSGYYGYSSSENCYGSGYSCDAYPDTNWGWALQAGVKVNLPMLAAGDALYLQAAYANGATKYAVGGGVLSLGFAQNGGWSGIAPDAVAYANYGYGSGYDTYTWDTENITAWSVTAAMQHYWSPTLRSQFGVSYFQVNVPSGSAYCDGCFTYNTNNGNYFSYASYGPNDVKTWQAAANLIWSPVAGLDIGAEVGYAHVDTGGTPYGAVGYSLSSSGYGQYFLTKSSDDRFYTRLRIQREF